jgi:hypothetical protein
MKFFGWRVYTVLRNQGKTLPARGPLDCSLQEKGAPLEKIIKFTFPVSTVGKICFSCWISLGFLKHYDTMSISMSMYCTEREFLDINLTKGSSLLLYVFTVPTTSGFINTYKNP